MTISAAFQFLEQAASPKNLDSIFRGSYGQFFIEIAVFLAPFGTQASGFSDLKMPAGEHQIGEAEQSEQLSGVLGQATVACFPMTDQVLDDMKWMRNFRAYARF